MIIKDATTMNVFNVEHLYQVPKRYHRTITILDAMDPTDKAFHTTMTEINGVGEKEVTYVATYYTIYRDGIHPEDEVHADTPDHCVQSARRLSPGTGEDEQPVPTPAPHVFTTDKDH